MLGSFSTVLSIASATAWYSTEPNPVSAWDGKSKKKKTISAAGTSGEILKVPLLNVV